MEPLLGPVDLTRWTCKGYKDEDGFQGVDPTLAIDWVIAGGESGAAHKTRPTHPQWVKILRDECVADQIAFFFKQWGDWLPLKQGVAYLHGFHEARQLSNGPGPTGWPVYRVGKAKAGRLLDGREWNELPEF